MLHQPHHLTAVPVLVVVPDVQHAAVVVGDGGRGVHDARVAVAHQVARDDVGRGQVVDLVLQRRVDGHEAQVVVDGGLGDGLAQREVQDGQRDVGRGHADGVAGELAGQLGQGLGHGLGGAGLGDDQVERGGAPAAGLLVEVVDQVLVVGSSTWSVIILPSTFIELSVMYEKIEYSSVSRCIGIFLLRLK